MKTSKNPMPTFLIIGATKSGTTALARYLGDHPGVFVFPGKETHFFDDRYSLGNEYYRSCFEGWSGQSAIGEATPTYLFDSHAIERIAHEIPNVRLIAMLRDPVERAYSNYWHNRSKGREHRSFDEAVSAERWNRSDHERDEACRNAYLERGLYMRQLEHVLSFFERESLLVLLYDDLLADPRNLFQAAAMHIGVDSSQIPASVGEVVNSYVEFRSIWLRGYAKRVRGRRGKILGRLNAKKSAEYPAMNPATRADLVSYFAEANDQLAGWLGRDLSHWSG